PRRCSVLDDTRGLSYVCCSLERTDMTRRFKELIALLLLGVSIALAPMACSDSNNNAPGGPTSMTPGCPPTAAGSLARGGSDRVERSAALPRAAHRGRFGTL